MFHLECKFNVKLGPDFVPIYANPVKFILQCKLNAIVNFNFESIFIQVVYHDAGFVKLEKHLNVTSLHLSWDQQSEQVIISSCNTRRNSMFYEFTYSCRDRKICKKQ